MKIGEVAKATGLSIKSIRYYHDIGLVEAHRSDNGYREYRAAEIEALKFLQHCRELGFTLDECRDLLQLKHNPKRCAEDVKRLAKGHLQALEEKMTRLASLHGQLSELVSQCRGGCQSECAIIDGLSSEAKQA
ncbi:MerR family transcriptional regulator [Shewanella algae]|uniref:MerR family transcriptional regulator n=1 Tax=Shewanella algae TaxID=38313 RepID=UPI0016824EBB|nr:MerR family transcriptional regulator [Shewanella algae]QNV05033.1 MerR family transcriptional regulator [Shewanella algae]